MSDNWRERASCAGHPTPDVFYPVHRNDTGRAAKAVCRECPVRLDCALEAHDRREEFGVWGGTTERERLGPLSKNLARARANRRNARRAS